MSVKENIKYYLDMILDFLFSLIDAMLSVVQKILGWLGLSFTPDMQHILTYAIALIILVVVFSKIMGMFKHWIYNTITGLLALFILNRIFEVGIPITWFTILISAVFGVAGILALLVLYLGGVFVS
ncbi:pro-sigmaK processing inhibitor BofA family protein [Candidatus Altiarchaeota archaeon]